MAKADPAEYSGTPLPRKLGIVTAKGTCALIALLAAPPEIREKLGDLPGMTLFTTRLTPSTELAVCFVRHAAELRPTFDQLSTRLPPSLTHGSPGPRTPLASPDRRQRP